MGFGEVARGAWACSAGAFRCHSRERTLRSILGPLAVRPGIEKESAACRWGNSSPASSGSTRVFYSGERLLCQQVGSHGGTPLAGRGNRFPWTGRPAWPPTWGRRQSRASKSGGTVRRSACPPHGYLLALLRQCALEPTPPISRGGPVEPRKGLFSAPCQLEGSTGPEEDLRPRARSRSSPGRERRII